MRARYPLREEVKRIAAEKSVTVTASDLFLGEFTRRSRPLGFYADNARMFPDITVGAIEIHAFGPNAVVIAKVLVHPDYRKRGWGRAIMARICQIADSSGCKLLLSAEPLVKEGQKSITVVALKAFYRSLGFIDAESGVLKGEGLLYAPTDLMVRLPLSPRRKE